MKQLTKAEESIMQVLWLKGEAFVKDIIEELPKPRPAYTTVSTIVRILEEKGFVDHKSFGKSHQYFPLISKSEYAEPRAKEMIKNYFGGRLSQLVNFMAKEENLSLEEIDQIMDILNKNKDEH